MVTKEAAKLEGWYTSRNGSSFEKYFGEKIAFAYKDGTFAIADMKPGYPNFEVIGKGSGASGAMLKAEAHFLS